METKFARTCREGRRSRKRVPRREETPNHGPELGGWALGINQNWRETDNLCREPLRGGQRFQQRN